MRPSRKSGFVARISSRITTVIRVARTIKQTITDLMSHSQFHSLNLFILTHAWLNLWDKHMTTGRINQVAHRTRHRHCDAPCDHAHRGRKSKVNPASRPSTVREQHIKPNHNRQREGGTSPHTHSSTASESLGESPTTDQDRRLTLAAVRGTTRND